MGATIHYELGFHNNNLEEGIKVLERFKKKVEELPIEFVGDLFVIKDVKNPGSEINKDDLGYAIIESGIWIGYRRIDAQSFALFHVIPTNEMESAVFGFSICPSEFGKIDPKLNNLCWSSFCKTNRRTKHHLLVIAILDIAEEMGILRHVSDETDFWESRNLDVLGIGINRLLPKEETINFIVDEL